MRQYLLSLSFICFLFNSCSTCPDNIDSRTTKLTPESLIWDVYQEIDSLIFIDQDDEKQVLIKVFSDSIQSTRVNGDCNRYIDVEYLATKFVSEKNPDCIFEVVQSINFFESNNTITYEDFLNVNSVLYGVKMGDISIITDNRQEDEVEAVLENGVFVVDTTILGKAFSNVYCTKLSPNRAILLSKELGVVYMKWRDGSYWLLEERK